MSRLNDLMNQLRAKEPELAKDLEREVTALAERRAFGLNFERHVPEAVDLPGRKARKGDKVRILPQRGQMPSKSAETLWRVLAVDRTTGTASLEPLGTPVDNGQLPAVVSEGAVDDLVVVAEFRDPIYPGLVSTGKVERGGDRPFHTVISAENYHALETLLFTHRGKVDVLYIDPPYNTGARDWKYNNDYVEGDDLYRHSKWLAFMERRLLLAKELLNPNDSVLIVTIDEREYLRLGLLLEQVFPGARIQMVSSVIKAGGVSRADAFGRSDEYIYFAQFGNSHVQAMPLGPEWNPVRTKNKYSLRWKNLMRSGQGALRSDSPRLFYPIFASLSTDGPVFHSVGEALIGGDRKIVTSPSGCVSLWPIRQNGQEGRWMVSPEMLRGLIEDGHAKLGQWRGDDTTIYYLAEGERAKVRDGTFAIVGRNADGSVIVDDSEYVPRFVPTAQWNIVSHDAGYGGARLLAQFVGHRSFPFPKSLYAVEDKLRFFVGYKPDALVVDYFAGSGTTSHAVMRLNKQDGGRRRSISVTNNEVAADEQKALRKEGLRPGDVEWERWGICEYITMPRVEAAITGRTPDGEPVTGDYKFTDAFPMAEGFEENVEFFTLTYEAPLRVASNREFTKIAPLLWMRAGSCGRRVNDISQGWDVADTYGVLADLDQTEDFLKAVALGGNDVVVAFIVTDEDRLFESVARELPEQVEPVRLYEGYLRNFEIESGRGAL
jgi:adenine-specific DNA-methyltransferase